MLPFTFHNPVKVLFGEGKVAELSREMAGKYRRALLVTAKGPFRENGLHAKVRSLIEKAGCEVWETGDIDSNPRLSSVDEGVAVCGQNGVDVVVALGGGSAMDCSKMIAASAKTGISAYEHIWGGRPPVTASLDTVMIPTIAATGTELNPSVVIVNDGTKQKFGTNCFHAKLVIHDPEIYAMAPYRLSVWGAMDILSHTFEYYFNGQDASEFQLRFSECIIHSVMAALRALNRDGADLNARGELMWAAVMAWGGPAQIGRGDPEMTCHWIEESFSGYFDTHHGACLGVLTPRWMDMVYETAPRPFARFARMVFGVDAADDVAAAAMGIACFKSFLGEIGAPLSFSDISDGEFPVDELRHVAKTSLSVYKNGIGKLRPFSEEDIVALLASGRTAL